MKITSFGDTGALGLECTQQCLDAEAVDRSLGNGAWAILLAVELDGVIGLAY